MKVVLDSNALIADFNMSGPNFVVLLASAKKGEIELQIPEIVLDETFNKFRQRIEKAQNDISSEMLRLNKLALTKFRCEINEISVEQICREYEARIRKIIEENDIIVSPYPTTSHKFLAKKAMLTKKPFNSNEKGYRDCLIWENIKSMISTEKKEIASVPEVVFISGNHRDFLADGGVLHSDLISELEDERLKTDSLVVYERLYDFNEAIGKISLEQESRFEGKLKNDEFWDFQLKSTIDEFLYTEVDGNELGNWPEYTPEANDTPTISGINDDYKIEKIIVKKISADEYLVDVEFDLEMDVDFFVDKSDYYSTNNERYRVVDFNWNDHVLMATQSIVVPMSISIIIDSNLDCKSIEINNFEKDYNDYY